jgi:hypothetical protein
MNRYEKPAQSQKDMQEKRLAVVFECQRRWDSKLNCRGCRFFRWPIFPVGNHDNLERCSQWDIIQDWQEKQQRTSVKG